MHVFDGAGLSLTLSVRLLLSHNGHSSILASLRDLMMADNSRCICKRANIVTLKPMS